MLLVRLDRLVMTVLGIVGRCLTLIDSNKPEFGTQPPRFTVGCEDPDVQEAFNLCFGNTMRISAGQFNNHPASDFLIHCLASIVHHLDWIRATCQANVNSVPVPRS